MSEQNFYVEFQAFEPMSDAIGAVCEQMDLPVVSGGSGKGWSMWSTLERCPRAFYNKYIAEIPRDDSSALGVGGLVHALLAFWYSDGERTPFDPVAFKTALLERNVNPESVYEAYRLFDAYCSYYEEDYLTPLATEYTAKDPKTGNTCRYDMIAELHDPLPVGLTPGIYIVEHKTTAKSFTWEVREGWDLDGEILGEIALWERAGLDKIFGKLQGLIVNVIGKQKQPEFHRAFVWPQEKAAQRHLAVLSHLEVLRKGYVKKGSWPMYFQGCITRYGKCDYYQHCLSENSD